MLALPKTHALNGVSPTPVQYAALYRIMRLARELDAIEQKWVQQGLAFFHVSGAGHEATAALAGYLTPADWIHAHYRDKALLLARGITVGEFLSSLICRAASHSAGRQMSAHSSAPELNVLSIVGPVGNNALQACGIAAAIHDRQSEGIVVCSVGDGTTQQGEFLEAVAEAVRWQLPVLFLIQDNHYSISTNTRGKTFFDLPSGPATEFYGLPIHRANGANPSQADAIFRDVVHQMRNSRGPQIILLDVERLDNHTNSDNQLTYRTSKEIESARAYSDPVFNLRKTLIEAGIDPAELDRWDAEIIEQVHLTAEQTLSPVPSPLYSGERARVRGQDSPQNLAPSPQPSPPQSRGRGGDAQFDSTPIFTAKAPYPNQFTTRSEYRGAGTVGDNCSTKLTMREAICHTLQARLQTDDRAFLYGQDIEDPKGDVFGVTRGLSTAFPGRVVNAPLSESTIVGTAIGRALAGQRPVAFLQFADFLPLAFNQIVSELGSMHWRTNGGWQCPVIVMATCGGYKPGLGPFHAQTMDGFAAHIPGVDVVMPSSAGDAAGMLNAAFESPRPTIFFYPKSCLNLSERTTSADVADHWVPFGKARYLSRGHDLTLVAWGNLVTQCEKATVALKEAGFTVDLLDLRSLSPWDQEAVIESASRTGRLVVAHEDNHTCGFGAELLATVAEHATHPVKLKRVTRPDTHIPFHFGNQLEVLPSYRRVLEACADLLDCEVTWQALPTDAPGFTTVRAMGSGPADETVLVLAVHVIADDVVTGTQVIAEVEATKAAVEISTSVAGIVTKIHVQAGDQIPVGSPIITISLPTGALPTANVPLTTESIGRPFLTPAVQRFVSGTALAAGTAIGSVIENSPNHRWLAPFRSHNLAMPDVIGLAPQITKQRHQPQTESMEQPTVLYLSRPTTSLGGRTVTSDELAINVAGWTGEQAFERTGVAARPYILPGQSVVTLAIEATNKLIDQLGAHLPPLSMIVCSTTSPCEATPSISCQVATKLADRLLLAPEFFAFDFNAACSGYLYGLRLIRDHLTIRPDSAVLLITSEVISPNLNPRDPNTVFLFGDAATATLVCAALGNQAPLAVRGIHCQSLPDAGRTICAPCMGAPGYMEMNGIAVARTAYKALGDSLRTACDAAKVEIPQLGAVVPHPGSKRILMNVADYLQIDLAKVLETLATTGNTSSSSIPLALDHYWNDLPTNQPIGLAAFGAGYTAGGAVANLSDKS